MKKAQKMEALSTTCALCKYFLVPTIIAIVAAVVGILVVPAKTTKEAMSRIVVTIVCSLIFGYPLYDYLHLKYSFINSQYIGVIFLFSGLPAWWMLGALARMGERYGEGIIYKLAKKFGLVD